MGSDTDILLLSLTHPPGPLQVLVERPPGIDQSPAGFRHAWNLTSQSQLAEAEPAKLELSEIASGSAAALTSGIPLRRELRFLSLLCNQCFSSHFASEPVP